MIESLRKKMVAFPILSTIAAFLFTELLYRAKVFQYLLPDIPDIGRILDRFSMVAIAMLFVVFVMKITWKEAGYTTKNLKSGLKSYLWVVIGPLSIGILEFAGKVFAGGGHFMNTPNEILVFLTAIILCISIGFCEETLFRIIPINLLRNKNIEGNRKSMFYCLIVSSVLFGLTHLSNMTLLGGDQSPATTIAQVMQTCVAGMIFGAIYWKTGSVIVPAIIHAVWDMSTMLPDCIYISTTTKQSSSIVPVLIFGLFMVGINLIMAMIILRKKKENGCQIEATSMRRQCFPAYA